MKPAAPTQTPTRPEATAEENERRIAWASAMIDVARETAAELANLPPAQRSVAITRAAVLSDVACQLLSGDPLPPSLFDFRTRGKPPHA